MCFFEVHCLRGGHCGYLPLAQKHPAMPLRTSRSLVYKDLSLPTQIAMFLSNSESSCEVPSCAVM